MQAMPPVFASGPPPRRAPAGAAVLPPLEPWNGGSRAPLVPADDPWATDFEKSGGTRTPRYAETMAWLGRLAQATPQIQLVSLGLSPEGRDIVMAVVSAEGHTTPEGLAASGKPTVFAHAGIHAGEIDGKDAGFMLLRDMTVRQVKAKLLDQANFLFVPILSVDGHERFGPYHRINQRGPAEMGWRTNARNLNLNRDFAKLDTPEVRAVIDALNTWTPDLYLDLHVTDGADYAYDITWGYNGPHAWSPNGAAWLDAYFTPAVAGALDAMGHVPGPLVFAVDDADFSKGITGWTASPRFSNGYGDARHVPTVLLENHSLKPYLQRVLGTYVFLESALRVAAEHGRELRRAVEADRNLRREEVPLAWKVPEGEPETIRFQGIRYRTEPSAVSGATKTVWTGQPEEMLLPYPQETAPAASARRPKAYWISPVWTEVIAVLERHGVHVERPESRPEVEATRFVIRDPKYASAPFEGRLRVSGEVVRVTERTSLPEGWVRITTNQSLGDLAMLLLEPESPDSFFQWGFFNSVLQRTEYVEPYVLEAMAETWLQADRVLAREFTAKLADPKFAADPQARLFWFFNQTPFLDAQWGVLPIRREE